LEGWIPSKTLWIYEPKTDSWSNGAEMLTPRGALTAQFVDGKLYAIGGFNEFTRTENEVYDPIADSWETKSPMPTPREHLASSVLDNQLYAIGGRAAQSNVDANEMYDHTIDMWKKLEPLPTARSGLTASTLSSAIFVFGGEGLLYTFEENEAYIPGEGWIAQQPMPISRHGLASSTVGENIYLIGGGVIPGFSFSAITEKYHNTVIPEFGILITIIFVIAITTVIIISKYWEVIHKKNNIDSNIDNSKNCTHKKN